MDILEKIQPVFKDVFDDDLITVTRETVAADVEDWDSFAQMQIVMSLEEMFHIKFRTSELEHFNCVGDVVDSIQKHLDETK